VVRFTVSVNDGIHYNVFFNSILKLICYLDYKLLLRIGCYHRNQVNSEFCMQVVERLLKQILRVRP